MRLTIARKIALAVTVIVIVCVGTMTWVASSSLQRGFVAYLNEVQTQDLDRLRELLEARYRIAGDFEWLRRKPGALKELLDQMTPHLVVEPDGAGWPRGPGRPRPPGAPPPAPRQSGYGADAGMGTGAGAGANVGANADAGAGAGTPPAPPAPEDEPPAPAPPPPNQRDPMGFASRISIVDAAGRPLIGSADVPPGIEREIKVDGVVVGRMRLLPLRRASGADPGATIFLRGQMRTMLLLSAALIGFAVLAAFWLARHMLRPVAALRDVTARLARGELDARAPLLSQDEVAELALHVNAMAVALEASERQRRKMLADVSHELRTPLTVIRGEIEALLDGIRQADAGALESLHAEVLRLNKLVDDLHQLTLADAGDLHYQRQTLDLAALLEPILRRYQPRAAAAGLDLSWALGTQALAVDGDAGRLTQVVTNLLENSLRYTDRGGQIVAALSSDGVHAELTVEDSAPGVPATALASIFERLYRVDSARGRAPGNGGGGSGGGSGGGGAHNAGSHVGDNIGNRAGVSGGMTGVAGGSGLGLAICKALVAAHGGAIVAEPSVLGGLKLRLRLPLKK